MKEGFSSDDNMQQEQSVFVGGDVYIPTWDREGSVPPPLPVEDIPPEPTWKGKELGLPPPLQEQGGETVGMNLETQDSLENESNEEEIPTPNIPTLDRELMELGTGEPEKLVEFLSEKSNLPPDANIELYHGLNGGLEGALAVLESPEQGVKQISGPCLAVYPVGQFWKPGGAGLKYSIPRGSIEFPGESNINAKFRIGDDGVVSLVNGIDTLPLTEFNGEVIRTDLMEDIFDEEQGFVFDSTTKPIERRIVPLSDREKEIGMKIEEKLGEFSQAREEKEIHKLEESIRADLMSGK